MKQCIIARKYENSSFIEECENVIMLFKIIPYENNTSIKNSENEIFLLIIIPYENTSFTADCKNEIILLILSSESTSCAEDSKVLIILFTSRLSDVTVSTNITIEKLTKIIIKTRHENTMACFTAYSKNEIILLIIVA
jgi:RAB protein geranylgeranyltransferase component A